VIQGKNQKFDIPKARGAAQVRGVGQPQNNQNKKY